MRINELELYNFRNYEELKLSFPKNVNLILGKNAQGKTNLLESIYITSMGKSFRTGKESEMIRFGEDFGRVKVTAEKDGSETSVELVIGKDSRKSAKIDGVRIKKASQLLENIYVVIFSPEDLKIVKDEPEKRRKFIDRELCQLRPLYCENLSNYRRALFQRNTYLKENETDPSILDLWDMQLAEYGAAVTLMRGEFIEKIRGISETIHSLITDEKEKLKITYSPNVKAEDSLRAQKDAYYAVLKESAEQDMRQRTTTRGPHKDDMEFYINGINARNFGSQGQQRTAALSLKLAELNLIKEETGEDAVLLLDDVMSELDETRQEFLIKSLADIQMFITTTEIPENLKKRLPQGETFFVNAGRITRENYG